MSIYCKRAHFLNTTLIVSRYLSKTLFETIVSSYIAYHVSRIFLFYLNFSAVTATR